MIGTSLKCKWVGVATLLVVMGATCVATAETAEPLSLKTTADVEFGGDIRVRQVFFDDIPIIADPPGVTRGGENHFFRIRSRVWSKADFSENVGVYGRFVNEWRYYITGDDSNWDFPDEAIVDALYIDINGLFNDLLDVRLGRQDLIYGTGKLILEGTPKDGSRTLYHDAVRLRFYPWENNIVDVLGIYNQPENQLEIKSEDRDLTGRDPAFNDLTESGGAIYLMNSQIEGLPFEAYYIYKHESWWTDRTGTNQPARDTHTIGTRWMPKTDGGLSANIELAQQFGDTADDRTIQAWMADAVIRQQFQGVRTEPIVGLGIYHLTGNKVDTRRDEGWNPLWARWPQYSELYVYAWDAEAAGRWSNVTMPYVSLSLKPTGESRLSLLLGRMTAPERDGPGGGSERGWLGTARYDFAIGNRWVTDKDRLFGHLLLEVLEPGNYYEVSDTAYFARWELSYAF